MSILDKYAEFYGATWWPASLKKKVHTEGLSMLKMDSNGALGMRSQFLQSVEKL